MLDNKLIFNNLAVVAGNSRFSGDFNLQSTAMFDVKKLKENILKNKYYDQYNPKINLGVLLRMIEDYKHERMEAAETVTTKFIETEKIPMTEKSKEIIKELSEKLKPVFSTDQPPAESERDKFIKKQMAYHMANFIEIWKEQDCKENDYGTKFIVFESKFLFSTDYIKLMTEKDLINYDKK